MQPIELLKANGGRGYEQRPARSVTLLLFGDFIR